MAPTIQSLHSLASQYERGELTEEQIHDHYGGETYYRVIQFLQEQQYQSHYA